MDIQNCGTSNDFALLQNPGNGVVFDPGGANEDQNLHLDPHDFGFIDINNDGRLDLFMGLCTGWRVFIQQNCCPNDVNGDGTINVLDLIELLLCFGQPGTAGCTPADVNSDGIVNVLDLIELLLDFGQPCA